MSHFATIKTQFKEISCVVEAMVAAGVPREHIEVNKEPKQIYDYQGKPTKYLYQNDKDERFKEGDKAHVIIRRKHLASGHNDLGVFVDPKGESRMLVCDWARTHSGYNAKWIGKVTQEYVHQISKKHYASKGKTVQRVNEPDGTMKLFIRA